MMSNSSSCLQYMPACWTSRLPRSDAFSTVSRCCGLCGTTWCPQSQCHDSLCFNFQYHRRFLCDGGCFRSRNAFWTGQLLPSKFMLLKIHALKRTARARTAMGCLWRLYDISQAPVWRLIILACPKLIRHVDMSPSFNFKLCNTRYRQP